MVDAEPGVGLAVSAVEHGVADFPAPCQFGKGLLGTRPQRTLAGFAALAVQGHKRMAAVHASDLQIGHPKLRCFRDPRPGVVEAI